MGAYHIFVNPAKKEYFDPTVFGDGNKHRALYHGLHRYALKLLTYSPTLVSQPINEELNTWTGDPIYIGIDDDNPTPESTETLHQLVGTTEEHNLYWHAYRNYRDIGFPLLKHFLLKSRDEYFLQEFFERAQIHQRLFNDIATIYFESKDAVLKKDIVQHFGKNWEKKVR